MAWFLSLSSADNMTEAGYGVQNSGMMAADGANVLTPGDDENPA